MHWNRAPRLSLLKCGLCGEPIAPDAPYLTLTPAQLLPGQRAKLLRCERCGGPVPVDADLPPVVQER
jgi:hypothetical protein